MKQVLFDVTIIFVILFTAITGILIGGLITPFKVKFERKPTTAKGRHQLYVSAAATGAVAVAAISVLSTGTLASRQSDAPAKPQSQALSMSTTKSKIAFLRPQDGDHVKQCPAIEGTGQIPADKGLWIVVVPDTAAQPRQYWIESPAKMDGPDHWTASGPVSIDKPKVSGVSAYIYAVLIDKGWSDYFTKAQPRATFLRSLCRHQVLPWPVR